MKITSISRWLTLLIAMIFPVSGAFAAEPPKLRHGLWEQTVQVSIQPGKMTLRVCIGKENDSDVGSPVQGCDDEKTEISKGKVSVRSVCRSQGTTVTSDGIFEGNFETGYKGRVNQKIELQGKKQEMSTTIEARWLGPCKDGQKSGDSDVIMPDGKTFNVNPK